MKLYIFSTSNFGKPKVSVEEYEVTEKSKTYISKNRRFNKDDIGRVSGYRNNECILLEYNPSKACEILLKAREEELKEIKKNLEKKKLEIENLKSYITEESEETNHE